MGDDDEAIVCQGKHREAQRKDTNEVQIQTQEIKKEQKEKEVG